jgi:hypothetical protein
MKKIKYIILPLAILCVNAAQAGAKQVNIPFSNEPIFSQNHDGLFFNYDMGDKPAKKVVCELSYVYKGWLEFRNQGDLRESGTYGDADGVDTITLTNKGKSSEDQYLADRAGTAKILAIKHEKAPKASASCHYEFDNNP